MNIDGKEIEGVTKEYLNDYLMGTLQSNKYIEHIDDTPIYHCEDYDQIIGKPIMYINKKIFVCKQIADMPDYAREYTLKRDLLEKTKSKIKPLNNIPFLYAFKQDKIEKSMYSVLGDKAIKSIKYLVKHGIISEEEYAKRYNILKEMSSKNK